MRARAWSCLLAPVRRARLDALACAGAALLSACGSAQHPHHTLQVVALNGKQGVTIDDCDFGAANELVLRVRCTCNVPDGAVEVEVRDFAEPWVLLRKNKPALGSIAADDPESAKLRAALDSLPGQTKFLKVGLDATCNDGTEVGASHVCKVKR